MTEEVNHEAIAELLWSDNIEDFELGLILAKKTGFPIEDINELWGWKHNDKIRYDITQKYIDNIDYSDRVRRPVKYTHLHGETWTHHFFTKWKEDEDE